jgi:ribosome biogenesis protein MAK21
LSSADAQKSLKKALGDFMKGLDFGSVPAPTAGADDSEEISEVDSEDEDEDEESEDEGSEEDENQESEGSEEESEEERPSAIDQVKKAKDTAKVKVVDAQQEKVAPADPNATSGSVSSQSLTRLTVGYPCYTSVDITSSSTSSPLGGS